MSDQIQGAGRVRPLTLREVKVTGGLWKEEQETVRKAILPYQWEALNDRVPDAAPSYCMHNFRAAAEVTRRKKEEPGYVPPVNMDRRIEILPEDPAHPEEDRFYGFVFQDSDFAKWIEAVGYSLCNHPDAELEKTADQAIDLVCAAQQDDGYLDTYYILNGLDGVFRNLKDHHELYCMGHLIEGAVSYFEATGKDKLLRAAMRYADYAVRYFMTGEEPHAGYPGHEIAEMALARLYEVTGKREYLDLAVHFLNERGQEPLLFGGKEQTDTFNPFSAMYYQAHQPVREQTEAVGHAVRAVYLYSGMAEAARLTGDESLKAACRRLWDSITGTKLYITGGIGGTVLGESFSYPYDLPADSAYSETCAAIGLVFFARRMLELEPDRRYGDVMELALYNTVLAGKAMDGKSFFYVNPLEANPKILPRDGRLSHVRVPRRKWFGCACCPPNLARLVSSVQSYAYTSDAQTLWVHLYLESSVETELAGAGFRARVETDYPQSGSVRIRTDSDAEKACLALRIPGWCRNWEVKIRNNAGADIGPHFDRKEQGGYLYLTGCFRDVEIELELEMAPRLMAANNAVREAVGKAALMRGPVTYCLEEADNGAQLQLLSIHADDLLKEGISESRITICGREVIALDVPGYREVSEEGAALYRDVLSSPPPEKTRERLRFIPYSLWANRGAGEMSVYVRMYSGK